MKILERLKQLKEEIQRDGKRELEEFFTKFLQNNPQIEKILFTAYTPYFNDGEPCYYGIHRQEVFFTPEGLKSMGLPEDHLYDVDDEDRGMSSWSLAWLTHEKNEKRIEPFPAYLEVIENNRKAVDEFFGTLSVAEEIVEIAYGDHVSVTITRNGVDVEEYEHD